MKTYKQTKAAVRELVTRKGINNVLTADFIPLIAQGHTGTNLQRAMDYFRYSSVTAKYREV